MRLFERLKAYLILGIIFFAIFALVQLLQHWFNKSIQLIYFNTFDFHTTTLSHIFMSEFLLHTAHLLKTYFPKNRRFLGGIGVVYNYIHSIYYIFFERYAIDTFFYVVVWKCGSSPDNTKILKNINNQRPLDALSHKKCVE